eukprot:scaffold22580_cov210-Cylindrotheca_fusiformis.AAC.5
MREFRTTGPHPDRMTVLLLLLVHPVRGDVAPPLAPAPPDSAGAALVVLLVPPIGPVEPAPSAGVGVGDFSLLLVLCNVMGICRPREAP